MGFRQVGVPIEREARHAGRTKYSTLACLIHETRDLCAGGGDQELGQRTEGPGQRSAETKLRWDQVEEGF